MKVACKASIFCLAAMAAWSGARAQQGASISFQGAIVDETCTMAPTGGGQAIAMDSIQPAEFTRVGDARGRQRFSLALAGCAAPGQAVPRRASVRLLALDTRQPGEHLDLSNAGQTGAASGVQVRILSADGQKTLLASGAAKQAWTSVNVNDAASRLDYAVDYIAVALPVTSGKADAAVNLEITYP